MAYPRISAQVATDFFGKIGGNFSFNILTREYILKIGNKQISAPTIYEVFMSGADLVREIIDGPQEAPMHLVEPENNLNQKAAEVSDEAA